MISKDTISKINDQDLNRALKLLAENLDTVEPEEMAEIQAALQHIQREELIRRARHSFLAFVQVVGKPILKFSSKGQHHQMAEHFDRIIFGDQKFTTMSLPPRFGKSEFGSILLPAFALGVHPEWKIIQASSTTSLASGFGAQVKNLIESENYKRVFPGVKLSKDTKSKSKFSTNAGGIYHALGVDSNVAGLGGDLIVLDDLVSEQEAKSGNPDIYDKAWDWFQMGPLQRLQPSGRILVIGTRWNLGDPIGRIKEEMRSNPGAYKYVSIEFTALDEDGESNFPEIWSTAELVAKKSNMAAVFWGAQYEQNPTIAEGSIIKEAWWRKWTKMTLLPNNEAEWELPEIKFTLLSIDSAFTKERRSNPTAATVWGIFEWLNPTTNKHEDHILLIETYEKKMDFSELKREATMWIKKWKPDCTLIEAKSSGPMLRSELREAGIHTEPVMPKPGEDKVMRLNSVSDVFASGMVFYINTKENRTTIEQCSQFPNSRYDDRVDTISQALRRFRRGGFFKQPNDIYPIEQESVMPIGRIY